MSVLNEKWIAKAQGNADEYCLLTTGGKWVIAFRVNGEFSTVKQEKIVGRITDCVNACHGADTNTLNAIEVTGGLGEFFKNVEQVSKDHDQLKAKAAVLGESNENWMEGFEAVKAQHDELLATMQFMLAYENDDEAALDEIQEAFNQQDNIKDIQEFARCYCARKMRSAIAKAEATHG
jgi:hypothetical protein